MSGLSVPELLIALCAVTVGVSAIRSLRPSKRSRRLLPLTADQRSHLRMLVLQGQEDEAVTEVRRLTGLRKTDARIVVRTNMAGDPPTSGSDQS